MIDYCVSSLRPCNLFVHTKALESFRITLEIAAA